MSKISIYRQTLSSLKNPDYRFYYGALVGQMASMNMQMVARGFLAYDLTGSKAILGTLTLAITIPMLLLSLFGGVIAERVEKKNVMLIGQAGSAIVSLAVALALHFGLISSDRPDSWWILAIASVFQGIIMGLMMPSRQAILPEIVGEDQLLNAISLNVTGMNFFRIMSPAIAGFLIDAFGYQAVYFTMTGLYLMAVFFTAFLPETNAMNLNSNGPFEQIKEGLHYVRHEKVILFVLAFTLVGVILSFPYMMLMPVFAVDILKVGASGMGILISASGIGAITASLILASLPNKRRGLILLIGSLVLGLALVFFSFSRSWYLSLISISFVGMGQSARMALGNTLVQYYVDNAYRGRVMSIYMMNFGIMGLGVFGAGILAEYLGVQWVLGGFASVLVLLTILAIIFSPGIRKLD
jgi:MFS family permease